MKNIIGINEENRKAVSDQLVKLLVDEFVLMKNHEKMAWMLRSHLV